MTILRLRTWLIELSTLMRTKLLRSVSWPIRRRAFTTAELLSLTKALIEANTSPDPQVKEQFDWINDRYGRLDKIPYDQGMKLVALVHRSQLQGGSREH